MKTHYLILKNILISFILVIALAVSGDIAIGHGGKSHIDNDFTNLKALQKAIALYDQLIINDKLSESWETDLEKVEINVRSLTGNQETVISFHLKKGDPKTVFFFFNEKGEYAGSNFSGK